MTRITRTGRDHWSPHTPEQAARLIADMPMEVEDADGVSFFRGLAFCLGITLAFYIGAFFAVRWML